MSIKRICDICKKEFNDFDRANGFSLDAFPGYGSVYDGDHIAYDFCCSCFDHLVSKILRPSIASGKFVLAEEPSSAFVSCDTPSVNA